MIEINLLPEEFRKKETPKLALPKMVSRKTILMGLGCFFGVQILLTIFAGYQNFEFGQVKASVEKLKRENKDLLRQKSEKIAVMNRLKEIRALTGRQFHWWMLLNQLSDSLTKGIWLRHLSVDEIELTDSKNKVQSSHVLKLEGSVVAGGQETAAIGHFIKQLKSNEFFNNIFQEIKLSDMNQRRINKHDVYDFVLLCPFKKGVFNIS